MWSRSGGSLCSASSGQIKLISPHCHDFSLMSACWKFAPTGNRPELYTAARRAQLCTAGHRNEDVHEQRRRRHSRVRQTVSNAGCIVHDGMTAMSRVRGLQGKLEWI